MAHDRQAEVVIAVGLGAAMLLALGFVLQQHQAAEVPSGAPLRPGLLLVLLRRPMWLAGIATMVCGQLLGATALGLGSLVVVEPLLATNVLFALPLGALWSRRRLQRGDWIGAVSMIAGLALLLGLDRPQRTGTVLVGAWPILLGGGAVALVVGLIVAFAINRRARVRALMLAVGGGTTFGMQDVLTQQLIRRLGQGLLTQLVSWPLWSVVGAAAIGLTFAQNAFSTADLSASLPALTLAEPVTGLLLSTVLFGQGLRTNPGSLAAGAAGLAMMVLGGVLLTRSPLVLDPHQRGSP